ncbi:MAG: hypothetical protein V4636_06515 [Pseudomonadota bacterium]
MTIARTAASSSASLPSPDDAFERDPQSAVMNPARSLPAQGALAEVSQLERLPLELQAKIFGGLDPLSAWDLGTTSRTLNHAYRKAVEFKVVEDLEAVRQRYVALLKKLDGRSGTPNRTDWSAMALLVDEAVAMLSMAIRPHQLKRICSALIRHGALTTLMVRGSAALDVPEIKAALIDSAVHFMGCQCRDGALTSSGVPVDTWRTVGNVLMLETGARQVELALRLIRPYPEGIVPPGSTDCWRAEQTGSLDLQTVLCLVKSIDEKVLRDTFSLELFQQLCELCRQTTNLELEYRTFDGMHCPQAILDRLRQRVPEGDRAAARACLTQLEEDFAERGRFRDEQRQRRQAAAGKPTGH